MTPPLSRAAELVAFVAATAADGQLDLTALQAQRFIQQHQSLQGLDAMALARTLADAPALRQADGREQLAPLLQALSGQLPAAEWARFADALDAVHLSDSPLERGLEIAAEQLGEGWQAGKRGLSAADSALHARLAQARQAFGGVADDLQTSALARAGGQAGSYVMETAQEKFGGSKGAASQAVQMLTGTVDLARIGYRFGVDRDFRNLIVGTAGMYIAEARQDPGKPLDDIGRAATTAWEHWRDGLVAAEKSGTADAYLGSSKGALTVEVLAAAVPVAALPKLFKLAGALDELAAPGPPSGAAARELAEQAAQALREHADDVGRAQARGGDAAAAANLSFDGLAGLRRSQGDLRELVDGLRDSGQLDALLHSGALRPRELGYLARHTLEDFQRVPFEQALTASLGGQPLHALSRNRIGEIGEAVHCHDLARKGYTDIVPIQNNSGHGNDVVAVNPQSGRWEVFEVKASIQGQARAQGGDPQPVVSDRIRLATQERGHWKPENMWEEMAQPTAVKIRKEAMDMRGVMQVDTYWSRINLQQDSATGLIKGEPVIEPWVPKTQRANPQTLQDTGMPAPGLQLPGSLKDPAHPGHADYGRVLSAVNRMEAGAGIAPGVHSEKLAAAIASAAQQQGMGVAELHLRLADNQLEVSERLSPFNNAASFRLDPAQAMVQTVEQHSAAWAQARSSHYTNAAAPAQRMSADKATLQQLPEADRVMFERIRAQVPAHLDDAHVLQATVAARQAGIERPDQLADVRLSGERLFVVGTIPGFRAMVELDQPAPALQDSLQQNAELNRQLAQQQEQDAHQREQQQGRGPVMG